jgi:hypothetical protein
MLREPRQDVKSRKRVVIKMKRVKICDVGGLLLQHRRKRKGEACLESKERAWAESLAGAPEFHVQRWGTRLNKTGLQSTAPSALSGSRTAG